MANHRRLRRARSDSCFCAHGARVRRLSNFFVKSRFLSKILGEDPRASIKAFVVSVECGARQRAFSTTGSELLGGHPFAKG